jgi:hypothetical protein
VYYKRHVYIKLTKDLRNLDLCTGRLAFRLIYVALFFISLQIWVKINIRFYKSFFTKRLAFLDFVNIF